MTPGDSGDVLHLVAGDDVTVVTGLLTAILGGVFQHLPQVNCHIFKSSRENHRDFSLKQGKLRPRESRVIVQSHTGLIPSILECVCVCV